MGQGFTLFLYFTAIVVATAMGLRSLNTLFSLRKEKREVKNFYENELASEIRNAILDEVNKAKEKTKSKSKEKAETKDPLAGLLTEIYDDLYTHIAEEETARKKSIKGLESEIEKLRAELGKNT